MTRQLKTTNIPALFRLICCALALGFCLNGSAQSKIDLKFVEHLINRGNYNEAIFELNKYQSPAHLPIQDSINYFKGWANYSLKKLEESTNSFLRVSDSSPFYTKSVFFAGYNEAFLKNYEQSQLIFNRFSAADEPYLSLSNFEQSGIEFLKGNWTKGEEMLAKVDPQIASISQQVDALKEISRANKKRARKSAFWAGAMSAVIPGSGKIYASKTGEGIASFVGTTGFGLIAWENYHKNGLKDAKTLIFGCLFVANYVSTIYGSAISVKISANEYANTIHNQVLFQLHIPLRNFFE